MKRALSILMAFSMLITINASGFNLLAQQPNAGQKKDSATQDDPFQPGHGFKHKLPANARPGSTAERKAAWDSLTPDQQETLKNKIREHIAEALQKSGKKPVADDDDAPISVVLRDKRGNRASRPATKSKKGDSKITPSSSKDSSGGQLSWATKAKYKINFVKASYRSDAPSRHRLMLRQSQSGTYATGAVECGKSVEQFVRDMFQSSLGRQPDGNELSYWANTLTGAQAQGQAQLIAAAQNLGNSLFQSPEYAARGRSDYDYVYDLYKAFLQREPDQGGWDFWANNVAQYGRDGALGAFGTSQEFQNFVASLCTAGTFDADGDSLPDSFENQLADEFTPFYHVSAGETNHFARFGDYVPETPVQILPSNPPVSHYRVKPLGFGMDAYGNQFSFAQVDYLTLWDQDGGFDFNFFCNLNIALAANTMAGLGVDGFAEITQLASRHNLDNERSAVLVAAPTSSL